MKYSTQKLYCFSPPVMMATFLIETGLLIYTLVRYKSNALTRVVVLMLGCLALFQLAEYSVCGRFNINAGTWSRIGYVAITMLPPLGIHLIQLIAKRGWWWIKWAAYTSGLVWAGVFGLGSNTFDGHVCTGNYVIFQLSKGVGRGYFAYYYFWLFIGILMALLWVWRAKMPVRKALLVNVVGYLIFLVPTTVVNNLYSTTRMGIPSIMCGFAVLYALIMVFAILPLVNEKKTPVKPARSR